MLTLYHSPQSRSTALLAVLEEMALFDRVDVRVVEIARQDGSGGRDPANPHPEGKVPALDHDGRIITERGAIIAHLATVFPDSGLAPRPGTPDWGVFLTWMAWYQGVMEPVLILDWLKFEHPALTASFRCHAEVAARLHAALERGPWLMGAHWSLADLLCHGPYGYFPDMVPDDPLIRDWLARCLARPSAAAVAARDAGYMAALTGGPG